MDGWEGLGGRRGEGEGRGRGGEAGVTSREVHICLKYCIGLVNTPCSGPQTTPGCGDGCGFLT